MKTPVGNVSESTRAANKQERQALITLRIQARAAAEISLLLTMSPTPRAHVGRIQQLTEILETSSGVWKSLVYSEAARIVEKEVGGTTGRAFANKLRHQAAEAVQR